jgi:hypothetical protein
LLITKNELDEFGTLADQFIINSDHESLAARHHPETVAADVFFGVVAHHTQRLVNGVVAHAFILIVFAG